MQTKTKLSYVGAGIVFFLLLSSAAAVPLSINTKTIINSGGSPDKGEDSGGRDYTHTVLAEQCTATWCGYCPAVADYLETIYNLGYDFHYFALVDDMNSYADQRNSELGITGFPTVVFDGGYTRLVGDYGSTG